MAAQQVVTAEQYERKQIAKDLLRLKREDERLLKAYLAEVLELEQFKAEKERIASQVETLCQRDKELVEAEASAEEAARSLDRLDDFCATIAAGLEALTFEEKQEVLRLLVTRIVPTRERVRIEMVVPPAEPAAQPVRLRGRHPDVVEGYANLDRRLLVETEESRISG